ncbi:MAG: hypothetical protein WC455_16115 [Dehalococcoidia bacterium]
MTAEQFARWAEGYYGKYNPIARAELITWLGDKEPHFIAGLRLRVRDEYSNVYRMPPDIAKLREIHYHDTQLTYDTGRRAMEIATTRRVEIPEETASELQVDEIAAATGKLAEKVRR